MRHTAEASLDSQGRITVPPRLAELAEIERDVVFVGAGDIIELWNPARYQDYIEGSDGEFEQWMAGYL